MNNAVEIISTPCSNFLLAKLATKLELSPSRGGMFRNLNGSTGQIKKQGVFGTRNFELRTLN